MTSIASPSSWRLDFRSNGYAFIDVSNGFRDSGKWRVEGSALCSEWQRLPAAACSEIRLAGGVLHLKRSNSEIVSLRD